MRSGKKRLNNPSCLAELSYMAKQGAMPSHIVAFSCYLSNFAVILKDEF